ncbi:MAG: glycosyltransferase [Bacteroidales bacterium]|jgi:glycosyltransferase involved in cell wall biosynthesis|nr:glycosyltransferase [Bacteroidales bacterium]MDD3160556.1 glycosyltransferase [Bacteroidales bacterium]
MNRYNWDGALVSVVIVTYNQEAYISQAIESALAQQCSFPIEIVIGDDASKDNTGKICEEYALQYPEIIRLTRNATNKGLMDNYFDTMLRAKGKYIADCAGDDYWIDPYKLQRQVDLLENNPNVVLTHTNYKEYHTADHRMVDDIYGLRRVVKPERCSYKNHVYDLINQINAPFVLTGSSCFLTKAFLNAYQANTSFFRNKAYPCEDFQLVFFLLREGDFLYEAAETTVYRINDGSISNLSTLQKQLQFAFSSFKLKSDLLLTDSFEMKRCASFFESRLKEILSLCIRLKETAPATEALQRARDLGYPVSTRIQIYEWVMSSQILSIFFRKLKGD